MSENTDSQDEDLPEPIADREDLPDAVDPERVREIERVTEKPESDESPTNETATAESSADATEAESTDGATDSTPSARETRAREREQRSREREAERERRRAERETRRERRREEGTTGDAEDGDLPPEDLERAFAILDEAIASDAIGGEQFDQLLTVFEHGIANPAEADPEEIAEMISMLEELVLEPDDLSEIDLGGILDIFEQVITTTTGQESEDLAAVFDLLEEGVRDPSSIDPADVDRFRTGIEEVIVELTDPSAGGFGGLFALSEAMEGESMDLDADEPVDPFRLARVAAGMTQRASGYSMESGVRTGTRMAYAAANSQSPAELLTNTRAIALDELQRSGIDIGEEQESWLEAHEDDLVDRRPLTREELEARGAELLDKSSEVGRDEAVHPSFPVLLEQLATDEARILRLLATAGPQPIVDIYDKHYIPFKKTLLAENLTMVGSDAGCRNKQRVPVYLQNLRRLGLVTISDHPVENLKRYQVLEAQQHVVYAREEAARPKAVYKRLHLTDLGVDFCEMCFPFEVTAEQPMVYFRRES